MKKAAVGYQNYLTTKNQQNVVLGSTGYTYGAQLTDNFNGDWENWLAPFDQNNGVWKFGYQNGYGVVSACVMTSNYQFTCSPNNNNPQDWYQFNLPGPLACVNV